MLDTRAVVAALAPVIKDYAAAAVQAAQEPLLKRIADLEGRALEKGDPGEPGRDGVDGTDAAPISEDQIEKAVSAWLEANPPAAGNDGADGQNGADGRDGVDGTRGVDGLNGRDGVGLAGALIDRSGALNVTLSTGDVVVLGPVVGQDGANGADGAAGQNGQSWEAMEVVRTGPRTIEFSFDGGDQRNTFELEFPIPLYRGVFTEGETYSAGDMVTWAGSLWHCNEAGAEKPGEQTKAWTLAVKRGRDGKDFAGPQTIKPGPVKI